MLHALQDWFLILSVDLPSWIRVEGSLVCFFERSDMDQRVVTVDQFTTAMAFIQEASASLRQEIDSQQSRQFVVQDETPYDSLPPPLGPTVPRAPPYLLHGHSEVASPTVVQTTVLEDTHTCTDRIEQRIRQLRVSDSSTAWDDLEGH